jgi:hypothetical protein
MNMFLVIVYHIFQLLYLAFISQPPQSGVIFSCSRLVCVCVCVCVRACVRDLKIFVLVDANMRMVQYLLQSKLGRQQGSTYKIARIQSVE